MLALIADVHANLEALDAVLREIDGRAPGARVVCAGDVVGYGPDPDACVRRLVERDAICVRGNHEEMVLGMRDDARCVAAGILAVSWTRRRLAPTSRRFLERLPAIADLEDGDGGLVVCHGDLDDAGRYVSDVPRATRALERLREVRPRAGVLVCGHTHAAMSFTHADRRLVNPGAVGQARDGVTRARWALLDGDALTFHSVAYDHATTLAKLREAGLVARVTLTRPQGLMRHVETGKARAARALVRVPAAEAVFRFFTTGGAR